MKTIIAMLLVFAATAVSASKTESDTNFQLTVEGKFLSESHVDYEIYKMSSDSTLEIISREKGNHWFTVKVDIGEKYIVKFKSRTGQVKYLHIDAKESGTFAVDVDFMKIDSALLKVGKNRRYVLEPIPSDKSPLAFK